MELIEAAQNLAESQIPLAPNRPDIVLNTALCWRKSAP